MSSRNVQETNVQEGGSVSCPSDYYFAHGRWWEFLGDDGPKWMPFAWRYHLWALVDDRCLQRRKHIGKPSLEQMPKGRIVHMFAMVGGLVRRYFFGPPRAFPELAPGLLVSLRNENEYECN